MDGHLPRLYGLMPPAGAGTDQFSGGAVGRIAQEDDIRIGDQQRFLAELAVSGVERGRHVLAAGQLINWSIKVPGPGVQGLAASLPSSS